MWRFRIGAIALAVLLAAPFKPAQAADETVVCKDGSTSKGGRGACRGHGGVDKKASKAAEPAPTKETKKEKEAKEQEETKKEKRGDGDRDESRKEAAGPAAPAAETTVVCKDGSTSKGGRGACRGHGGVDKKASKAGAQGAAPPAASAAAPPGAPPPAPVTPPTAAARPSATSPAPAARGEPSAKTTSKNTDPTGATAKCKDGTYSHARHHTGACSNHGGVAEWLDAPAK